MASVSPAANTRQPSRDILSQAYALISDRKFFPAAVLLQEHLRTNPDNPDFLYPLATCQSNLDQFDSALQTLELLEKSQPDFAGLWLERGRIYIAQGAKKKGMRALEKCVRLNPAYIGAWAGLLQLDEKFVDKELYAEARSQYKYLTSLHKDLVLTLRLFHDDETYKAERLCRAVLEKNPRNVDAMRILARIGVQYGVVDDAEFLLESACEFEPANYAARVEYIDVLHKRQQYGKALEQAKILQKQRPKDLFSKLALANQQMAIGEFDLAIRVYDEVLESNPSSRLANAQLYLTRGHAHKTNGNIAQSIDDYRSAYRKRPTFGDAYWSLANLKTYRFSQDELERMINLVDSSSTTDEDKVHLLFALGKSLEDSKDYAQSFKFYERGNQLNKKRLRYNSEEMTQRMQLQEDICTEDFLKARRGYGSSAPDPIFIVGLPRAGSTLLEQILASHSQVDGTLELHHVGFYAQKLDGRRRVNDPPRYPMVLRDLNAPMIKELGERYIRETRIHRAEVPYFIDKMPNNFRHIGMISMILPNAKIIDARRHPMSCCFSGYKQLFASGQEFTYGQREIATYYRDYCHLMDHWDSVLPGKILRVYYEDVVRDLETQVRRILEYCGFPFEESCLVYYKTERSIRTPSAEQVRQPIYSDGLEQWRNYERWLSPMKEVLEDCLAGYPAT